MLGLVAGLDEQIRAAREAWPDIDVADDRFAAEIQRRVAALPEPGPIKASDVYIAIACIDGNTRAIEAVRSILVREVTFAASKTSASRDQLADTIASLSRVLFVDEPERPAALRDYSG